MSEWLMALLAFGFTIFCGWALIGALGEVYRAFVLWLKDAEK